MNNAADSNTGKTYWHKWYIAVIAALVVQIISYYLFTRFYH